ncbi:hypothetical protein QCD70_02270 [Agreia sp. PsM10]|uniref:hypothetical protein n=1 Tax=Agreia sp. PsM10 TaxID=3030533 RepID=UPI00263AA5DD|nr:hypothetical protein [Agreia sp. PsM10]MDN4639062.1 hypothetical protein [Agreia sp. PsM10]
MTSSSTANKIGAPFSMSGGTAPGRSWLVAANDRSVRALRAVSNEPSLGEIIAFLPKDTGSRRLSDESLSTSTVPMSRMLLDLVVEWLNLPEPESDPYDYLFAEPMPETVPREWLVSLGTKTVVEDPNFVMPSEWTD